MSPYECLNKTCMLLSQCSRNVSYEERNSLHPTQGSKRESLAHLCAQSNGETVSSCWTQHDLKMKYKEEESMGVFCCDCAVMHKGQLPFLLAFFPSLLVFLLGFF